MTTRRSAIPNNDYGSRFIGFDASPEDMRLTGVPASFFTQVLPQISNVNELKVLLHFMYLAGQKRGTPKWVGWWELEQAAELRAALKRPGDPRPPEEHLREGLELALARGTILRLVVDTPSQSFLGGSELEPISVTWFLLNTTANRDFFAQIERGHVSLENTTLLEGLGQWDWALPGEDEKTEDVIARWRKQRLKVRSSRADIFTLYEQNIGLLNPIISEKLREAAAAFPPDWVEDAFKEAVSQNKRSWAYISRILDNRAAGRQFGPKDKVNGQQKYTGWLQ